MKLSSNILIIITLLLIASCTETREDMPVNMNGDQGRTNNYEQYGVLSKKYLSHRKFKAGDNSGASYVPLAFTQNRIAFPTIKGSLIMLQAEEVEWEYKLPQNHTITAGMAADPEHNIYMITDKGTLISVDQSGKERWQNDFSGHLPDSCPIALYSDLLATFDGLYVAVSCGLLAKYDFSGKLVWKYYSNLEIPRSFCSDVENNIYIPLSHNSYEKTDSLLAFSPDGKIIWQKAFENCRLVRSTICSNGKVYVAGIYNQGESRVSKIFALNSTDGSSIWEFELNVLPLYLSLDGEDNVYAAGYNSGFGEAISGLFKIDKDGKLAWKNFIKSQAKSPLIIGEDMIAMSSFEKAGQVIYFFNKDDGRLENNFSLSNKPIMLMMPTVTTIPSLVFAGAEKLELIIIDESKISKVFD